MPIKHQICPITKLLDGMAWLCMALLFSKYAIHWANLMFDWHLLWYFLENIPYILQIILLSKSVISIKKICTYHKI